MEFQPINLTELTGTLLGMSMVLIPVMGITVRIAAKPLIEALKLAGLLDKPLATSGADPAEVARLARRVTELEQQLARMQALPEGDLRAPLHALPADTPKA